MQRAPKATNLRTVQFTEIGSKAFLFHFKFCFKLGPALYLARAIIYARFQLRSLPSVLW